MIQWYPGHMHKASKEFKKILPQVDLVIEVLDARLPFSSQNPMLAKLRGNKPGIYILNKSDLADDQRLATWQVKLEQDETRKTLTSNLHSTSTSGLNQLCRQLIPKQPNRSSMIYAMIAGIPNVGKSTLINRLASRAIAKTGNEAALTRFQQRIQISPDLTLIDTPGVLWPNIENPASGYRLAATGAIRDTALDIQDVAYFIAEFFLRHYPQALQQRYQLEVVPSDETELLQAIARLRGCIVSGGQVDFEKVSRLLIAELRSGTLGTVCFETPQMIVEEMTLVETIREQKAAKKAVRKKKKREDE
ncbi:MAG: ribosome biogenesis GTPase YlqF [Gammaproteobacteria bacterium]|nr:ribosome biogenesis GTPase YlqF [Gammaproteobacteria bacterium]